MIKIIVNSHKTEFHSDKWLAAKIQHDSESPCLTRLIGLLDSVNPWNSTGLLSETLWVSHTSIPSRSPFTLTASEGWEEGRWRNRFLAHWMAYHQLAGRHIKFSFLQAKGGTFAQPQHFSQVFFTFTKKMDSNWCRFLRDQSLFESNGRSGVEEKMGVLAFFY